MYVAYLVVPFALCDGERLFTPHLARIKDSLRVVSPPPHGCISCCCSYGQLVPIKNALFHITLQLSIPLHQSSEPFFFFFFLADIFLAFSPVNAYGREKTHFFAPSELPKLKIIFLSPLSARKMDNGSLAQALKASQIMTMGRDQQREHVIRSTQSSRLGTFPQ